MIQLFYSLLMLNYNTYHINIKSNSTDFILIISMNYNEQFLLEVKIYYFYNTLLYFYMLILQILILLQHQDQYYHVLILLDHHSISENLLSYLHNSTIKYQISIIPISLNQSHSLSNLVNFHIHQLLLTLKFVNILNRKMERTVELKKVVELWEDLILYFILKFLHKILYYSIAI